MKFYMMAEAGLTCRAGQVRGVQVAFRAGCLAGVRASGERFDGAFKNSME